MESGMQTADVIDLTKRLPTEEEIENAAEAATAIARAASETDGALRIADADGETVTISPALCTLITDVLAHVARGDMVTIVGTGAMLTTQRAADVLNVSRPFLSKLLKEGEIPFIQVGAHRRVQFADVMAYKEKRDAMRKKALKEMADFGQMFDAQ